MNENDVLNFIKERVLNAPGSPFGGTEILPLTLRAREINSNWQSSAAMTVKTKEGVYDIVVARRQSQTHVASG